VRACEFFQRMKVIRLAPDVERGKRVERVALGWVRICAHGLESYSNRR
jgi:hypothetical protein